MSLLRCGEAQKQLGEAEKKFVQSANIHFLTPLRSFSDGEYRAMQVTHTLLIVLWVLRHSTPSSCYSDLFYTFLSLGNVCLTD